MRPWPFSVEVPVRFSDCDPMRHANNAALVTYLEIARTDYYMKLRGAKTADEIDFILARVEIDFRSQATFGETMVVLVRPASAGESSFQFEYEIRDKNTGRVVATARTVQVCYDYATGRKKAIPPQLRSALEADGAAQKT